MNRDELIIFWSPVIVLNLMKFLELTMYLSEKPDVCDKGKGLSHSPGYWLHRTGQDFCAGEFAAFWHPLPASLCYDSIQISANRKLQKNK